MLSGHSFSISSFTGPLLSISLSIRFCFAMTAPFSSAWINCNVALYWIEHFNDEEVVRNSRTSNLDLKIGVYQVFDISLRLEWGFGTLEGRRKNDLKDLKWI